MANSMALADRRRDNAEREWLRIRQLRRKHRPKKKE
jgi:hypothetical protein